MYNYRLVNRLIVPPSPLSFRPPALPRYGGHASGQKENGFSGEGIRLDQGGMNGVKCAAQLAKHRHVSLVSEACRDLSTDDPLDLPPFTSAPLASASFDPRSTLVRPSYDRMLPERSLPSCIQTPRTALRAAISFAIGQRRRLTQDLFAHPERHCETSPGWLNYIKGGTFQRRT